MLLKNQKKADWRVYNMNANEIVAKSTKLGAITNQFKGSLDEFSSDLKSEIKTIEHAVLSINDWEGELYNGFYIQLWQRNRIERD